MSKIEFQDELSIIPNLNDTNYIKFLKNKLEVKYYINLNFLNNPDFDELASNPFHLTYVLLSHYNEPIQNYHILDDLELHCLVSSLYTCSFLTSKESERLTTRMSKLTTPPNRTVDGRDPANVIRRFDKLKSTKFSTLVHSSAIEEESPRQIYSQNFLTKLLYAFDIILSNRPYITLNNYKENKAKFSQYLKKGFDALISDYSELLNLCLPKDLIEDTLCYHYLNDIYFTYLQNKINGIEMPISDPLQFLNTCIPKGTLVDTSYINLLMKNRGIKGPISDPEQYASLCHIDDIIESTLYYYKLENTFHTNLLMKSIGKLSQRSFNIEKLDLLAKLPNVFSRNSWCDLIGNVDHIEYLSIFLLPRYQEVFFIILYNYIDRECADFNKKISHIKKWLISALTSRIKELCLKLINNLNFLPYPSSKFEYTNFDFNYNYDIAKDISSLFSTLYVDNIKSECTFSHSSSKNLITYLYNLTKMMPKAAYTPQESYLYCKIMEHSEAKVLPNNYNEFLILKNILTLKNYEYDFPDSDNENINILFVYLSDLVYCCVLIRYVVNYSTDFIKRFIPLFNVSFNVISEFNDYSSLFHTVFDIKEIKCSNFSDDEVINALKIMRDASCYFSEVIFEFYELTMLSADLSNNDEFSILKNSQAELSNLILDIEQDLNNRLSS